MQRTENSQNHFVKQQQSWTTYTSNFKSYYNHTVIKIVWHWQKKRFGNSEVISYIYG